MNRAHSEGLTFGQRAADAVAQSMGSWRFILIQTAVVGGWIVLNTVALVHHWDVFPYILLNLLFSTQAAYAAPIIMQSQNRQAAKDRDLLEHAYLDAEEHKRLLSMNTELTQDVHTLTQEIHRLLTAKGAPQ